jgi:2-oxoglutarate ferredoxin oxidoreductase subunit gamma
VFNICVLGALIGATELLRPDSVMKAIGNKVPKDFLQMNNTAFELGIELVGE